MYINVREAAKRLGVSETQIRRLIKRNRLKAINIGTGGKRKDYRIKKEDLESIC